MELSPFLGHGELFSVPHVRKTAEKTFLDSVRNINLSYGTKTKRRRRTRSWPPSESNASFHCFKQTTENRWEKNGSVLVTLWPKSAFELAETFSDVFRWD